MLPNGTSFTPQGALAPLEHKETRPFTTFEGTKYTLPSDEPERQRLEMQHRIVKQAFDNKLVIPPVLLKDGDKVLDSATGCCSWLLDYVETVPKSVEIHGIDIEPRLFPASESLPDNVHLSLNSVTNLPTEWSDKFAFVNQRLLMAALQKHEWPIALKELHRVLAPKGWLQLCEPHSDWSGGPIVDRHKELTVALFESRGLLITIASKLPGMLKNAGFVNVHVDRRVTPLGKWAGKKGEDGRDNVVAVWKGMKTPVMMAGGLGFVHSEEEFDELLKEVGRELDGTPGAQKTFVMIYAQKSE